MEKGDSVMNETNSTTCPRVGKTTIDEYIDALIQNTANGLQPWHTDMSGPSLRYYYNAGHNRIYIMQDWINDEGVMFSLRMVSNENPAKESLIASEHIPHEQPSALRDVWLAAQDHLSDDDMDALTHTRLYVQQARRQILFDEFCRAVVCGCEEILEVFQSNNDP
jgi:hypothetical protein